MPVNKPVYKLFEEERCFGDEIKHSTIENWFTMESEHMQDLLAYVQQYGDKTYAN